MKVYATYNIKGGVGKTATAVNLAYTAREAGDRVLLWDIDPQGSASYYFRVKPKVKGGGAALVKGRRDLADVVKSSQYEGLDVVPGDFSYRKFDLLLAAVGKPHAKFRKLLREVEGEYDTVFIDCPPSISLASETIFRAADALIVPLIPTTLSLRTYEQLDEFLAENRDITRGLQVFSFFSMADNRKRLHRELMEQLRAERPDILSTVIPASSDVERMGVHREPVAAFSPSGRAARYYRDLWNEIRAHD